jgi:hypothetical protein
MCTSIKGGERENMALSIQIRGAGTAYSTVAAAKTADNLAKATNPSSAGGWVVTGAKADFTTTADGVLADLKTNRSSIASVGVTGADKLVLTGSEVKAYKDVVLKLSNDTLIITDDASGLGGSNFSSLDAVYTKIFAINVNDNLDVAVAYNKHQASINEQGLENDIDGGSTQGVKLTDFSGSSASLTSLLNDAQVKAITIKDSIANLTTNKAAIILEANADVIADDSVKVSDTLANIDTEAGRALITELGDKLSASASVLITMTAAEINAAKVTSTIAAFDALPDAIKAKSTIVITGSAADLVKNAANITALGSRVSSISGTTGATIANLTSLSALKTKFSSISITDTAANLAKDTVLASAITSWTADKISGIKISAVPKSADLTKIVTAATAGDNDINVSISDTSGNINKDLALTNSVIGSNSSSLAAIEVKDGTAQKKAVLKMSNEQYSLLKDTLTGQITFNLSAVAYVDLSTVAGDSNVVNYGVKDAFSSIDETNDFAANITAMFGNTKLASLDITNATVANVATITSSYNSLTAAEKLKFKSVTVTDTSSNLLSIATGVTTNLKQLGTNKLVTKINALDAAIDKITTLKSLAKVASIKVADTDANYRLASNAKLIADLKVTGFSLTGVALSRLTGANDAPNYLTNAKITSIGVSETATNVLANRAIMNNSKISSITANGASVANIAALSAEGEDVSPYSNPVSIHVTDNWTNIKNYFATGGDGETENLKVKSFTVS